MVVMMVPCVAVGGAGWCASHFPKRKLPKTMVEGKLLRWGTDNKARSMLPLHLHTLFMIRIHVIDADGSDGWRWWYLAVFLRDEG